MKPSSPVSAPDDAATPRSPGGPPDREDLALVQAAQAGSAEHLEELIGRLRVVPRYLEAINRRHGRALSREDLDDLGQDTAIRIWRKLGRVRVRGTLNNWIYRFCGLEYMNRLRSKRRSRSELGVTTDVPQPLPPERPPLEELLHHLEQLPENEAAVVELRHFDDLSFDQIGARLGVPGNTAKTRYHRGLVRLRTRLRPLVPEDWR